MNQTYAQHAFDCRGHDPDCPECVRLYDRPASDTPRTDSLVAGKGFGYDGLIIELARTLERENARLREALELIACGADGVTQARAALVQS